MTGDGIDRRRFLRVGAAIGAGGVAAAASGEAAEAESPPPLRAVILEFGDRWTERATGLLPLLAAAGFEVAPLDTLKPPLGQASRPHLLVFGSFTNNGDAYHTYVRENRQEIAQFVSAGGVVLEMTQSDQFGARIEYLPSGMTATRGDRDLARVYQQAPDHPLTGWWPEGAEHLDEGYFHRKQPNWESFERWAGLRVLLSSEPQGGSPCLLEGAHGRGRIVASSLWLDKVERDGAPAYGDAAREASQRFFDSLGAYVSLVSEGKAPGVEPTEMPPTPTVGPMIGHVGDTTARLWLRPGSKQRGSVWRCELLRGERVVESATATPDGDHDGTLLFDFSGLQPGTEYRYRMRGDDGGGEGHATEPLEPLVLTTAPPAGQRSKTVLGFGSCAPSDPSHVWTRVLEEGCEGFVFLGDTPYIDSNDLDVAREKHRRFLAQPEIAEMIRRVPCWGTWDDHDFGRNDGHGDYPGKHTCRVAFTEYRANATFGHAPDGSPQADRFGAGRGIYTSFRRGPLEVFLLDPRWFSRTEPSWAEDSEPTCLGAVQWSWLQRALKQSTAAFKALATGMIWDDKQNSESDDWHTYRHEREAIFDFIRGERIPGCLLIGGDIHVSRALNYGPRVGYELWQFIVSPLHDGVIPALDVPHPNLVHHALEPHVFLRLEADDTVSPARLKADWINRDGRRVFGVSITSDSLAPPRV